MSKKKNKKRFNVLLFSAISLAVLCLAVVIFVLLNKAPASIYVFPENPKQGDTVFIRVKSSADNVMGDFGNENLVFYRKGKTLEWIAFLGIDADQKPGDYKISVNTSASENLTKNIKVALAGFSTARIAKAPGSNQGSSANGAENIRKNDNPPLQKVLSNFTTEPYFNGPFSFPLSRMQTSGFSFGRFISFAKDKIQHLGVDLRASKETEVYAVNDGKVVLTVDLPNYGKTIVIDHGLDIFSLYLHLDKFKVSQGDMVRRGQGIGLSGDTGYSTAPHLHFSMRVGSSRIDPVAFIETSKKINDNFLLADISNALFLK